MPMKPKKKEVKIVPLPVENELSTFMIWHNSMDNDPAHRWLRDYLMELNRRV